MSKQKKRDVQSSFLKKEFNLYEILKCVVVNDYVNEKEKYPFMLEFSVSRIPDERGFIPSSTRITSKAKLVACGGYTRTDNYGILRASNAPKRKGKSYFVLNDINKNQFMLEYVQTIINESINESNGKRMDEINLSLIDLLEQMDIYFARSKTDLCRNEDGTLEDFEKDFINSLLEERRNFDIAAEKFVNIKLYQGVSGENISNNILPVLQELRTSMKNIVTCEGNIVTANDDNETAYLRGFHNIEISENKKNRMSTYFDATLSLLNTLCGTTKDGGLIRKVVTTCNNHALWDFKARWDLTEELLKSLPQSGFCLFRPVFVKLIAMLCNFCSTKTFLTPLYEQVVFAFDNPKTCIILNKTEYQAFDKDKQKEYQENHLINKYAPMKYDFFIPIAYEKNKEIEGSKCFVNQIPNYAENAGIFLSDKKLEKAGYFPSDSLTCLIQINGPDANLAKPIYQYLYEMIERKHNSYTLSELYSLFLLDSAGYDQRKIKKNRNWKKGDVKKVKLYAVCESYCDYYQDDPSAQPNAVSSYGEKLEEDPRIKGNPPDIVWKDETKTVLTNLYFLCFVSKESEDAKEQDLENSKSLIMKHIRFFLENVWKLLLLNGEIPASVEAPVYECNNFKAMGCRKILPSNTKAGKGNANATCFSPDTGSESRQVPCCYDYSAKNVKSTSLKIYKMMADDNSTEKNIVEKMLNLWNLSSGEMHTGGNSSSTSLKTYQKYMEDILEIAGWTMKKIFPDG